MNYKFRNWSYLIFTTIALILLIRVPLTRSIIFWILPLGSGIDDLIFFILLFFAVVLLLVRIVPVKNIFHKVAHWLMK